MHIENPTSNYICGRSGHGFKVSRHSKARKAQGLLCSSQLQSELMCLPKQTQLVKKNCKELRGNMKAMPSCKHWSKESCIGTSYNHTMMNWISGLPREVWHEHWQAFPGQLLWQHGTSTIVATCCYILPNWRKKRSNSFKCVQTNTVHWQRHIAKVPRIFSLSAMQAAGCTRLQSAVGCSRQ